MSTIHANSAREAVVKLCTLPLLAGENVSSAFVVPTVATAVDLVIHLDLGSSGQRQVREVAAVSGRVENGIIELADVFRRDQSGHLVSAGGMPANPERFARAGFDLATLLGSKQRHVDAGTWS